MFAKRSSPAAYCSCKTESSHGVEALVEEKDSCSSGGAQESRDVGDSLWNPPCDLHQQMMQYHLQMLIVAQTFVA